MRLTALCAVLLLLMAMPAHAQPPAAELGQDWWQFSVTAGYGGYALPVANSALGRQWAGQREFDTGLFWQIGRNLSVVPVRIDLLHRRATAFKGRVEIVSAHGYAREEDPLGHFAYYSQELLAPPSVPLTLVLAPRVCPLSEPGAPVRLLVRLYQAGVDKPLQELPLTVTQLEPYYVYSLYLDGEQGRIYSDALNPGNRLRLSAPSDPPFDAKFFSSGNFTLTAGHEWLTRLPLAARDFGFVFADLKQVAAWPAADQSALVAFMVGGGHLCLFNATAAEWRKLPLAQGAQEVGRGRLLPVAGGFAAARAAVTAWLEGEIEELALWLGGTSAAVGLGSTAAQPLLQARLELRLDFALQQPGSVFISHRPGYLNPVWLYREACLPGMLEPWDYPEFSLTAQNVARNNSNLRTGVLRGENFGLAPLANATRPPRSFPLVAVWIYCWLVLAACAGALPRRWRALGAGLALGGLLGAGACWWQAREAPGQVRQLELVDADLRCPETALRGLYGAQVGRGGRFATALPGNPVVRRVSWEQPGHWAVEQDGDGTRFSSWQGRDYLALLADSAGAVETAWPVTVQVERPDGMRARLVFNTTKLDRDACCFLLGPGGWSVLPGGQQVLSVEFEAPAAQVQPGLARLAGVGRARSAPERLGLQLGLALAENQLLLRDTLRSGWPALGTDPAGKLLWGGLLQQPQDHRGYFGNQAVLFVPLPPLPDAAPNTVQTRFLRLTIPLGSGR